MSLKNSQFVDQVKLDSYAEQVYGSLSKTNPVLKKSIELGLASLKVKLEETDKSRPLTNWEKIRLIEEHLESKGELLHARPSERHEKQVGLKRQCMLTKWLFLTRHLKSMRHPLFLFG